MRSHTLMCYTPYISHITCVSYQCCVCAVTREPVIHATQFEVIDKEVNGNQLRVVSL